MHFLNKEGRLVVFGRGFDTMRFYQATKFIITSSRIKRGELKCVLEGLGSQQSFVEEGGLDQMLDTLFKRDVEEGRLA